MSDPRREGVVDADAARAFGARVDFGRTAVDYAKRRAGFPERFFADIAARRWIAPGMAALDLGCGTGAMARGLAQRGLDVVGLDPAAPLLTQARALDAVAGVRTRYVVGRAERLPFADGSFDVVTAGQCWHWFHRPAAAAEATRVLRPGGRLLIAHFDWLPLPGGVVAATEALIRAHNPAWPMGGGAGLYPAWLTDMAVAGLREIESFSFDVAQPYAHEDWRGRVRASGGVGGALPAAAAAAFDAALADLLARDFPEQPLLAPHRVWVASGRR